MGMAMGSGDGKRPPPVMNVTPLVDVTLVVLIIFMTITPLMTKTFWLNLPKKEDKAKLPPPTDPNQALVMTVDRDGTIRINKTVLEPQEVATRLPRMLAAKKQKVLYFDAHNDLAYHQVVSAMDLARQGGARSIAVLTTNVIK